jgi:TatD DNase family protein
VIDCHTHLSDPCFDADREAVLSRAMEVGVGAVLVVGQDLEENRRVVEVCDRHDLLFPCAGLHPDRFADRFDDRVPPSDDDIEAVCAFARAHMSTLTAIGEVGLDFWCAQSAERRDAQRACLRRMAMLAAELDLPLNVHSRSAGRYTLEVLAECAVPRVLMHAFDGRAGHALRAFEAHGWLFSIPPSVVRSRQKQKLVRALPLEALALETDSPVLGPDREARNEPANIVYALRQIAEIKRRSEEEVRAVTTANARQLFRLP